MIKPTKSNLIKIEQILIELGYTIRYEKGGFQSGYCIVEDRKVVVINKFFEIKVRIDILIDIIANLTIDANVLTKKTKEMYFQLDNYKNKTHS